MLAGKGFGRSLHFRDIRHNRAVIRIAVQQRTSHGRRIDPVDIALALDAEPCGEIISNIESLLYRNIVGKQCIHCKREFIFGNNKRDIRMT